MPPEAPNKPPVNDAPDRQETDPNENFTWEDLLRPPPPARQETDPNFKALGATPPHHGKTTLLVGDGRGDIGQALAAAPDGAQPFQEKPIRRALSELLQIFGVCGAPYIGDLGKWLPAPKKRRPPNPEKQGAAADKRERRARRNKEGI